MSDQLAHLRDTFGIDARLRMADKAWDESRVNRHPAGDPRGGQFAPKDGAETGGDGGQRQPKDEYDLQQGQRDWDQIMAGYGPRYGSPSWDIAHDKANEYLKSRWSQYTIEEVEQELIALTYEKAAVFDPDGKMIAAVNGYKTSVEFTEEEVADFGGATFTHNHPGGEASLSVGDVKYLFSTGLAEIRAVTPKHVHRMISKTAPARANQIGERIEREATSLEKFRQGFLTDLYNETITVDEANEEFWHSIWTETEASLGDACPFTYTREKRNASS